MEFIRKHPRALVATIAFESIVLTIVGVAGIASAHNSVPTKYANPICNMSAGAAADISAAHACDYTPNPIPGTRSVTQPSNVKYINAPAVTPGNGPHTQYQPEYPFNGSGQQVSGWTNTWSANPPTNTTSPSNTPTTAPSTNGSTNNGTSTNNTQPNTTQTYNSNGCAAPAQPSSPSPSPSPTSSTTPKSKSS